MTNLPPAAVPVSPSPALNAPAPDMAALTSVVRDILAGPLSQSAKQDLLFLEAWERDVLPGLGAIQRARLIRRANPAIAAAIRSELKAH